MPHWIYAVESYPGTADTGRKHEYIQVLGHQVGPVEGGKWFKLAPRYDRPFWTDFVHRGNGSTTAAVANARHDIHTASEVADKIIESYGFQGIVQTDMNPDEYKQRAASKEREALAQNKIWKESIVSAFESGRKMRLQGEHGFPLNANPLISYAYRSLGLPEPDSIAEIKAKINPELKLSPEIMALLQQVLAGKAVVTPEQATGK